MNKIYYVDCDSDTANVPVEIEFRFVFGAFVGSVIIRCGSRSSAAKIIYRFRKARREVHKNYRSGANHVLGSHYKVPSLRWLACRWVCMYSNYKAYYYRPAQVQIRSTNDVPFSIRRRL